MYKTKRFEISGHKVECSSRIDQPNHWIVRVDGELIDGVYGLQAAKDLAAKVVLRKEHSYCGGLYV